MKITPEDIYNFYYLEISRSRIKDDNKYKEFLKTLKRKYLTLFKPIITDQIQKYIDRGRIDKDLTEVSDNDNLPTLLKKMKKTYRSDMKRHNENWENVIEQLIGLSAAITTDKLIYYIDRVNNAIHNTYETILTKLPNGYELMESFEQAHKGDIQTVYNGSDKAVVDSIANPLDKKQLYLQRRFGNLNFESKFDKVYKNFLIESPDTIYSDEKIPTKNKITFFVVPKIDKIAEHLMKMMISETKYNYDDEIFKKLLKNNIINNETIENWLLTKLHLSKNDHIVIVYNPEDKKVYVNNKHIKTVGKYLTHYELISVIFKMMVKDLGKLINIRVDGITEGRDLKYNGRAVLKEYKRLDYPTPIISYWQKDVPPDITKSLITNTKFLTWPKEINIETAPRGKEDDYDQGDISLISLTNNSKLKTTSLNINPKMGVADKYLSKKYPGMKFESKLKEAKNLIIGSTEDRLKEKVYKIFKSKYKNRSFKNFINDYDQQPSLLATKFTVNHPLFKDYDIECCEGRYKGYLYYFPIVKFDQQQFIVDLGDNLDGNIIAKVLPVANDDYKIKKTFTVNEFNKKFNQLQKEYNK